MNILQVLIPKQLKFAVFIGNMLFLCYKTLYESTKKTVRLDIWIMLCDCLAFPWKGFVTNKKQPVLP